MYTLKSYHLILLMCSLLLLYYSIHFYLFQPNSYISGYGVLTSNILIVMNLIMTILSAFL